MDFAFSEEQEEFRATLRRFFEDKVPAAARRRAMEGASGFDPDLWKQMGTELGLQGVAVPEALGGQGFGFLELGIVFEEAGRVLLPAPLLATALAVQALRNAASREEQADLLPSLASGAELATLALVEDAGRWDAAGVATEARPDEAAGSTEARPDGAAVRLHGAKAFVPDAHVADRLVVVAREPGSRGEAGLRWCTLPADAPGVRVTAVETLDPLRRQARVELGGAPARVLGAGAEGADALRRTCAQGCILLAAEMAGAAQRCLDMAVAHATERVQFARPVGSFQAIKHKAAEVLLELELARSAAYWALWVADEDGRELEEAAHVAKAVCGDALRRAAAENIQIHGGIGFTWEHDAHLYYKRAQSSDTLFGDSTDHRAALAAKLGL